MNRLFYVVGIFLLLTGCASITGSKNQPISVGTTGCEGAKCTLKNDKRGLLHQRDAGDGDCS